MLCIYAFIQESAEVSDALLEPQPLWEYPSKALSREFTIMEFDFTQSVSQQLDFNSLLEVNFTW